MRGRARDLMYAYNDDSGCYGSTIMPYPGLKALTDRGNDYDDYNDEENEDDGYTRRGISYDVRVIDPRMYVYQPTCLYNA